MKKVLFTLQWYKIPSSFAASANALCDENIINELKKSPNIEIHTLSYGLPGYPYEDVIDNIYVHRFKRSRFWSNYILTRNEANSRKHKFYCFVSRVVMRIKQVFFFYKFPNYEIGLTRRFEKEALKLHKLYNYDLIISEFNGIDSLSAGAAIKKKYPNIKFLPICWDSIAGGRLAKWMPANYCRKLRIKTEVKFMRLADAAIVMRTSETFHTTNKYNRDYLKKFIFLDVPYFIPINKYNTSNYNGQGTLKLLYSGTMTDRNPSVLLQTLEQLGIKSSFTFITLSLDHNQILKLQRSLKFVNLRCLPYMSHEELLEYQKNSDILVNFGVSNTNAVSGKIFDYMSTGKPIISTISIDNEACIPYLKKYPKALIFDERKSSRERVQQLKVFIKAMNTIQVNMYDIRESFRENTPIAYVDIINGLLNNGL